MSMLSSYTTCLMMSRAPAPAPPVKLPRAAAMQPHKHPAATALALPSSWAPAGKHKQSGRAPLLVCRAQKNTYNIQPGALVHPSPTSDGDNWRITEDKDHINLKFNVGESTGKDKLEVATEDQVLLVIRYKGDSGDDSPASKLDVRLLMPLGYDGKKVKAAIVPGGWLQITIAKPKHETNPIPITE
ncbi:hypothetical protein BS78_06G071200 [Paspalum vaginatum]|nr:hypothetical protein BS78_06G071200 [Paspalum vaginatum]